jgi:hypothetical protein
MKAPTTVHMTKHCESTSQRQQLLLDVKRCNFHEVFREVLNEASVVLTSLDFIEGDL